MAYSLQSDQARHTLFSILLLLAALALAGFFFVVVPLSSFPSEDAAMLYLYSENFSRTGVIAYNAGGLPVEGATDFLWMILLAAFHRLGCPVYTVAGLISAASLFGTAFLLTRLAGAFTLRSFAALSLLLLAIPPVFSAAQGFSPLFFGLFLLLAARFWLERNVAGLLAAGLLACLVRPDGFVFAAPLTLAFLAGDRERLARNAALTLCLAVAPGLFYFAWRWWYFGCFMPLPFYVKAAFDRVAWLFHPCSLKTNLLFMATCLPALLAFGLGVRNSAPPERARFMTLAVCTVAVPFLFYSSMNLMQNIAYRFQYPLILGLFACAAAVRRRLPRPWLWPAALAACAALMAPWTAVEAIRTVSVPEETIPPLARALGRLERQGVMAVTEAGRLPYYSRWRAVDLWGLNTPELARELVQPRHIGRLRPDLLVLHAENEDYGFVGRNDIAAAQKKTWGNMTLNAWLGTRADPYEVFMVPHRDRSRRRGPLGTLSRAADALVRMTGYRRRFDVYYLFLSRADSPCHAEVRAVLLAHGAVPFETYQARRRAFR